MTDFMPLFFMGVAFLYSLAGFAGGSSFLALLLSSGLSHADAKPIVLCCNIAVSAIVFFNFFRAGHFRPASAVPFALASVPAAFFASKIGLSKDVILPLVAFSLAMASFRFFLKNVPWDGSKRPSDRFLWKVGPFIGSLLGLLSGIIGIGGGIFLSPLLILSRWASVREASAAASFFILVNSISGLAGRWSSVHLDAKVLPLVLFAAAGGWAGSRWASSASISPRFIQHALACVLGVACVGLVLR